MKIHGEEAFETALEQTLLGTGYESVKPSEFDKDLALFPEITLDFIRKTQSMNWSKLEALHGDKTGERILRDLGSWMDTHGSLATLRHCFASDGMT
jgi:type I restriction enzyme R subunit